MAGAAMRGADPALPFGAGPDALRDPLRAEAGRGLARFSISLIFALLLLVPDWPEIFHSLYGMEMVDRSTYQTRLLDYALSSDDPAPYRPLDYVTKEWLWNASISYLHRQMGIEVDSLFLAISFGVLWRFAYIVLDGAGVLRLLLLINPLIIDLAFSQLRVAVAVTLLSFVMAGRRPWVGLAVTALCCSIHTAAILFALMQLAARRFWRPGLGSLLGLCLTGAMVAVLIGPARAVILSWAGDRRAVYHDMSSSGLYLLFWLLMLGLLLLKWRQMRADLHLRYALVILSLIAVNLLTGGYSSRFLAAAFPSLLLAMGQFPSRPVSLIDLLFVPYAAAQWLYWTRLL